MNTGRIWPSKSFHGLEIDSDQLGGTSERRQVKNSTAKCRLSYNQQRELSSLPETIEQLEMQIAECHDRMANPEFFRQDGTEIARQKTRLAERQDQLEAAYTRWEELENLAD